jgi:transcriptional regulator with PAS, ATPase and Fis domain
VLAKVAQLQARLNAAERELSESRRARYSLASFIGVSAAASEIKRQARRAAQLDATVLLAGETGSGKELLAHAIHNVSPRADKPFVSVNAAAIPETLLEAELFGAAPGAYTGAERKGRDGKFKLADGGTLFLDEVGDMALPLQAKLLRVLQEQEVEPLGANRLIRIDVRVIAATSLDLAARVADGRFRADLYYRLNVLQLAVPPLRARLDDLPLLTERLLDDISLRIGLPLEIDDAALALLAAYPGPATCAS